MPTINLYGYATSPFVRKTGCFLYYKGLDFTHVPVSPVDPGAVLSKFGGTQVPVLEIDGQWRREPSSHALWLDELFAEKPLCPEGHRAQIEKIDQWVSDVFLISLFRGLIDGKLNLAYRFRAWRLAALLSAHTPLPEAIRHQWPELLRRSPSFIQDMAKHMDLNESPQDMHQRIAFELVTHIGDGPYMGGFDHPTMLDFAVFPQLVWGYMFGLEENLSAAMHPTLKSWMKSVSQHLPENPTLVADNMQINALAEALK